MEIYIFSVVAFLKFSLLHHSPVIKSERGCGNVKDLNLKYICMYSVWTCFEYKITFGLEQYCNKFKGSSAIYCKHLPTPIFFKTQSSY